MLLRKAKASIPVSMFFAALFADLITYVVTSLQMTLNHGQSIDAFVSFMTNYAATQLPLALMEGILFFMFATYLVRNRPEIFDIAESLGKKKEVDA